MEENRGDTYSVNPLVYYQKPVIGSSGGVDPTPVQLVFPSGGFGLGIAVKDPQNQNSNQNLNDQNFPVLASAPELADPDRNEMNSLKATFVVLTIVNLVITALMFTRADSVDPSKVEPQVNSFPAVFGVVSSRRRDIESTNFYFTIILNILGLCAVVFEFTLGISAYCISVVLNFVLGTSSLPFFVYCLRYVLDVALLYYGLLIRSRTMSTFLPLHHHGQ